MYTLKQLTFPLLAYTKTVTRTASSLQTKGRQGKILQKLLRGKESVKRKRYMDGDVPRITSAISITNPNRQSKNSPRRVTVLNKLFMKHVSDLLATGEMSEEIIGRGLEISNVKVTQDFQCVNVFWLAKGDANDEHIENILRRVSGNIRHELSQLRLMGVVPRIQFVKDKNYSALSEVEHILSKADFGDDYEPTGEKFHPLRNDLISEMNIEDQNYVLPPMRYDVFGLDREEIMNKIKQSMTKTRQAWEKYEANIPVDRERMTFSGVREDILQKRDEDFQEFLRQRQYQKKILDDRRNLGIREYVNADTYEEDDSIYHDDDYIEEDYDDANYK